MKHLIICILLSMLGLSCGVTQARQDGGSFTTLPVEKFAEAIKSDNVIILDVRTPAEYEAGHIPNSINIDVKSPDFEKNVAAKLPSEHKVIIAVYCRSGVRSAKAAMLLNQMGHDNVINLEGGYLAWQAAGK